MLKLIFLRMRAKGQIVLFLYKRFFIGFSLSLAILTYWSIQWIPYDYPTAAFWIVKYWQARDQLFRVNHYGLIFIPMSLVVGLVSGYSKKLLTSLKPGS